MGTSYALRNLPARQSCPQILVVEDDVALAGLLRKQLQAEAYIVDVVHDGEMAAEATGNRRYSLIILDLNLPKLDGVSLLKQFRPHHPDVPVLVLTGRSRIEDKVLSLDTGADDCLTKPFSFFELAARVRALLRRQLSETPSVVRVADLVLDCEELVVKRAGKRIDLTSKEFALLEYMMRNAGRPLTRMMILENVWRVPVNSGTNLVDVYVKYVRDKVDDGFSTKLIRTIRGVGYILADPQEEC